VFCSVVSVNVNLNLTERLMTKVPDVQIELESSHSKFRNVSFYCKALRKR